MDKDGYPEDNELQTISNWNITKNPVIDLLEYIRDRWQFANYGYFDLSGKRVLRLRMSTGGWSGNESIIKAMQRNWIFWTMYWQQSKRGGHFWFRIPTKKRINKNVANPTEPGS